jgi:hypothetical protein
MDTDPVFHRPELAARLTAALLGDDPLSSAGRSGLFLSAPRRTGKSTFLRNDLIPAVEHAGAIAIYVDLWADKTRDPGDLIADAVRDTLALQASKLLTALRALKRVKKAGAKGELAGFKGELGFELETVGQPQGTTLVKAFEALHRRVKRPIVLVLDEAQHALSSTRGADTLFALKAARDALNITSAKPQLAILATGSARARIADMVMRKRQPFYGASTETFPPLGEAFVTHFAKQLLAHRIAENRMPHPEQLLKTFQLLGSRPEDFRTAVRDALLRPESDLGAAIIAAAHEQRDRILEEVRRQLAALSVLQRAVIKRMVESIDDPSPFSKDSIGYYRRETGDGSVSSSAVQKAMDALVTKGFVWRSARGVYALDDTMVAELFYDDRVQATLLRDLTSPNF